MRFIIPCLVVGADSDEKPQVLEARTLDHCLSAPSDILVWKAKYLALRALYYTLICFLHIFFKRGKLLGALLTYMVV